METVYNIIGKGYNGTREADPYITERLLHLLQPEEGEYYLDIGCGTGNYTIALSNRGLDFTGVEPSEQMLGEARGRDRKINWLAGSAEKIPAGDKVFDGVVATLTIHHWNDLKQAFKEIYRVTKDKGKLIVFTATPEQIAGYWLNHYFPQMLQSSIGQMPTFKMVEDAVSSAGFNNITTEKYSIQPNLQDHFLYSGKHRPEIYFDEAVRKGISSFAALANANEVEQGLLKLKTDIENGEFNVVKNSYDNLSGDYLFIAAQKR